MSLIITIPTVLKAITKFRWRCYLFAAVLMYQATSANAEQPQPKEYQVIVTNPRLSIAEKEIIVIAATSFKDMPAGKVLVVRYKLTVLTSQVTDENGDGKWDQLLIQHSIRPKGTDTLLVAFTDKGANNFSTMATIRLSLKTTTNEPAPEIKAATRIRGFTQNIANPYYQMEGPGIENDRVAFRAFFDYRNGKDIYGKIIATPVLKQVGVNGSWHTMQPWGMDILKVGNSLGAGALAVKENKKLYRLADADTSRFTALYNGPLSAAFKLTFSNWDVGTLRKNGTEELSIQYGDYFYRNRIIVLLQKGQQLLAGFANFIAAELVYTKHNAKYSSVATYGKQADGTATNLGLAVLFATDHYAEHNTTTATDSISNTTYVVLNTPHTKPAVIYFFACWEKTDIRFSTATGFNEYLNETANRLTTPLQVKVIQPIIK